MSWGTLQDPAFCGRLCVTLLHSLWLVTLLAAVARIVDRLVGRRAVERSYAIHVAALLASMLALPATYWIVGMQEVAPSAEVAVLDTALPTGISEVPPAVSIPPIPPHAEHSLEPPPATIPPVAPPPDVLPAIPSPTVTSTPGFWPTLAPWLAATYAVGVLVMLLRLALGMWRAQRLGAAAQIVRDGPLVDLLHALTKQWSMRVVPTLARAEQIVTPKLIGLLRPTILLPASAVSGLSTDELALILAHELAHVRRFDMWVNLIQRLAEVVLFFNPALWYLSRRIGLLREYCCDEAVCGGILAVDTGPHLRYAQALLRIVEVADMNSDRAHLVTLSAAGRSPSQLRRRIARLFDEPVVESVRFSRGGVIAIGVLAVLLSVGPMVRQPADAGRQEEAAVEESAAETPTETAKGAESTYRFTLRIVDPDGKPVPAALVEIRTAPVPTPEQILQGEFVEKGSYGARAKADQDGRLVVSLPENPDRLNFSIKTPGYGPYWADCRADYRDKTVPNEFTARLEAAWSVGGIVVDEHGKPIAGVEIRSGIDYRKRPGDNRQLGIGDEFKTDEQGAWSFDSVPVSMDSVFVEVTHPDFAPNRRRLARAEFEVKPGTVPTGRIVLSRGHSVSGRVTDDAGKPIQGALVRTQFFNDVHQAETNEAGLYTLVGCEPALARIVASAQGKAVDMKEVRIEPAMGPVDFQMQPGGKVRIRVLDENDHPIPKTRIMFQWWRGGYAYFPFAHVNQYADANGIWQWTEAPHDEFQADICRPGGMQITRQKLIARDEEYVLYPPPALVITGQVVDAETKQPIQEFHAVPGRQDDNNRIIWDRDEGDHSTDGKYRLVRTYGCHAHLVRIEANGYLSVLSRPIMNDEGKVSLDFELKKGSDVAATVLTPDGQPAAGAEAALGVAGSQIVVQNGEFGRSTYAARKTADESGKFDFPAQGSKFQVVVTHPSGYAYVMGTPDSFPEVIKLTAWARVEGTFRIGDEPAGDVPLTINVADHRSYGVDVPSVRFSHEVTTAPDGSFVFERVVPGKGRIGRDLVLMATYGALEKKSSSMIVAELPAGETVRINLGGTGWAVVGKLEPPDGFTGKVLWNFALVTLDLPKPETPASLANAPSDQEARKAWWAEWAKTEEGKTWNEANERYIQLRQTKPYIKATVGSDGTFRIDDVPPDEYVLRVGFDRESPGHLHDYRFNVPKTNNDNSGAPVELGVLKLAAE